MPRDILVGRVGELRRYPVKSMLGEPVRASAVGPGGLRGDRVLAVIDLETGMVASAKRPSRWARLLQLSATHLDDDTVVITFPDGSARRSDDAGIDAALSRFLNRAVTLRGQDATSPHLERAVPEEVLRHGIGADVDLTTVQIAAGAPAGTLFDFSPVQILTSASLGAAGAAHPAGRVEAERYRPNLVVSTPSELRGYAENEWVGHRLRVGADLLLEVLTPSPRCAIPTLAHGSLPADVEALRVPMRENFVDVPIDGHGPAPCLGVHVGVVHPGHVSLDDEVRLVD